MKPAGARVAFKFLDVPFFEAFSALGKVPPTGSDDVIECQIMSLTGLSRAALPCAFRSVTRAPLPARRSFRVRAEAATTVDKPSTAAVPSLVPEGKSIWEAQYDISNVSPTFWRGGTAPELSALAWRGRYGAHL